VTAGEGTHKLWGGRFKGGPAPELEAVNRSIGVDFRLWPFDVMLSRAWASALAEAGVLTASERDEIVAGLDGVEAALRAGEQPVASDEDIHTMIDRLLHARAGAAASRLHTGRSRNDQVATATRLWVMAACGTIDRHVAGVQQALLEQAEKNASAVMPAYTHMQRAQPVSAAHWLLAHFWPLVRDRDRIHSAARRADVLPLGSGAVAGSAFPVSRELIRTELGLSAITENSIDAVSDRDFIADTLYALTMLGMHLSRLAEDLIIYGSAEFGFVRFGDEYSTGSSMMPQKRNPDALELARGSGARVLGDLVALLATIKGLPTSYNKDLQEDKRTLFDAVDAMTLVLPAVAGSIATLTFNADAMRKAVSGAMMATDLADYLVRKRVTFRDAHAAVGRLVREAEEKGCDLAELPDSSFQATHVGFGSDVREALTIEGSLASRNLPGGTGHEAVADQIRKAKEYLATQSGDAERPSGTRSSPRRSL
jgi:argininosuccinate lyase